MKRWSASEIETLKENYNKVSNNILCSLFPDKTFKAIYKKAYKMGLRKTEETEALNRSIVRKGEKGASWKGGKKKPQGAI